MCYDANQVPHSKWKLEVSKHVKMALAGKEMVGSENRSIAQPPKAGLDWLARPGRRGTQGQEQKKRMGLIALKVNDIGYWILNVGRQAMR